MKRFLASLLVIAGAYLAIQWLGGLQTGWKHGERLELKQGELFYKGVDEAFAQRLGARLVELEVFNDESGASVKLSREDGKPYWLGFVVDKNAVQEDLEMAKLQFTFLGAGLSDVFEGKSFEIHLCDDELKSFTSIAAFLHDEADDGPAPGLAPEAGVPTIGSADSAGVTIPE